MNKRIPIIKGSTFRAAFLLLNIRNHKRFDVYLNDYNGNGNSCTFGYVDSRSVTQDAQNSDEAIREYSNHF